MSDGGYQYLDVSRRGAVATVTLNRPEFHNALNALLIAEVTRCFVALADAAAAGGTDAPRAVVLTGAGTSFCAGADLHAMSQSLELPPAENLADAERLAAMFAAIDHCPLPTLARINGTALGGGVGLIAACDIAVAAAGARFGFSEVRLGLAPAVIAPFVLRRIGEGHARALFLGGGRFDAARAREIGLVHAVAPADNLDRAVDERLAALLRGGPVAIAAAKDLVRRLRTLDPAAVGAETAALLARLRAEPEGREGIRAFLEKREPAWIGQLAEPDASAQ